MISNKRSDGEAGPYRDEPTNKEGGQRSQLQLICCRASLGGGLFGRMVGVVR